ncbi:hypothetical protein [Weissella viridescens]|uniref:hypothetical protein n=1 Tax=Weissella viridescens TaxID=1629 RepID=UPI003AF200F6
MNTIMNFMLLIALFVFLGMIVYGLFLLAPWVGYVGFGVIGLMVTLIFANAYSE